MKKGIVSLFLVVALIFSLFTMVAVAVAEPTVNRPASWGTNGSEYSPGIQADRMKNYVSSKTDGEIIVAVMDLGVDITHPFLQGRLVNGWGCDNNDITDNTGHGTHIAGTIVDCTPDNVKIMPVKFNPNNYSSTYDAFVAAVNAGAKVINLSYNWLIDPSSNLTNKTYNPITEGIKYALNHGVVVVTSAGNNDSNVVTAYPGSINNDPLLYCDNLITVSAVDEYDLPAAFSNYGSTIDVCAPGVNIMSCVPLAIDIQDDIMDGYAMKDGTSMAAPHVAAAIAMLALDDPAATPAELKARIKNMTVDLGSPGWDPVYGSGRIDFRMFSNEFLPAVSFVSATFLSLRKIEKTNDEAHRVSECNFIEKTSHVFTSLPIQIDAVVLPGNATDKSVTYTIANTSVAEYTNGCIYFLEHGHTVLTASKTGVTSKSCIVHSDAHIGQNETVTPISVNCALNSNIYRSDDSDFYSFLPTKTGSYIIYSDDIEADVRGAIYTSTGNLLGSNDNISNANKNFVIFSDLVAGETYYIKVFGADDTSTGDYALWVSEANCEFDGAEKFINQDARCIQFTIKLPDLVDTLQLTIGSKKYILTKQMNNLQALSILDGRFKVVQTVNENTRSAVWNINAEIPAHSIGSSRTIKLTTLVGDVVLNRNAGNYTLIAYGSSYKTNVTPGTKVSSLLNNMATSGYTFTAYTWEDVQITATTTTNVATGMKIVQRNSSGRIVHVYYVVLFGDVAGTGVIGDRLDLGTVIGDGTIDAGDSMKVLQHIQNAIQLGEINALAADVTHDGVITSADSDLILNHAVGNATINQNYTITDPVWDGCYYGSPVTF